MNYKYIDITILSLEILALLMALIAGVWIIIWAQKLRKKEQRLKDEAEKIKDKAKIEADYIIKQSFIQSQEVLKTASQMKSNLESKIDENLDQVIKDSAKTLEAQSKEVQKAYFESLQKVKTEETAKTKQELEEFKKAQMEQVKDRAEVLVAQILQKVLGKAISPKEHEDLVIKALDEAKKEGVLG